MERIRTERKFGLGGSTLRIWGLIVLAIGFVGRIIGGTVTKQLYDTVENFATMTLNQRLDVLQEYPELMSKTALHMLLLAFESCAAPIFACLLIQGFQHTADLKKYAMTIAGTALVCEIPFDYFTTGSVINLGNQNPVFGLLIALCLLYFYQRYDDRSAKNMAIKFLLMAAGLVWAYMLMLDAAAAAFIIITCFMWEFRATARSRTLAGILGALLAGLVSAYFLLSPFGFFVVHFYNGQKGNISKPIRYLSYPIIMVIVGFATVYFL